MPSPRSITKGQLNAAWTVYGKAPWSQRGVDNALYSLGGASDGWDFTSLLVMVAAVDQLYSAGHPRPVEATKRILKSKSRDELRACGSPAETVNTISEALRGKDRTCYYWPFASKFAHFFVSPNVPIYDRWALRAIEFHCGTKIRGGKTHYSVFAECVGDLRSTCGRPSVRKLDWYLWLSAMYRDWIEAGGDKATGNAIGLGRAVYRLFSPKDGEIDLREYLPMLL